MFLDKDDDWKPGDGLCAPLPSPKKEIPWDREDGLMAGIGENKRSNTPTPRPQIEKCSHKKVYADFQLCSYPPQRPWICSLCGEEGYDIEQILESESYENVKKRFGK